MKILVLNYEFPPIGGGASPVSYDISRNLALKGHQVTVVTMQYKGLARHERVEGMEIYRIPCLREKENVCHPWEQLTYIVSSVFFLRRHLRNRAYDVCHTHFIIPTGVIAWYLKKRYGIPYVVTAHGSDVIGHNNKRFKLLYSLLLRPWRGIVRQARVVVSPSAHLIVLMEKSEPRGRYCKIQNGIETSLFRPLQKRKSILVMCRLQETKGVQTVLEAVSRVPMGAWKLDIVGDGPYRPVLEKMTKELGIEDKVCFHGWIASKSEKQCRMLGEATVFISASQVENCPVSVLEALCAGCKVLVSDIPGHRELLGNYESYFVAGSVEECAEKIKNMITSGQETCLLEKEQWDWKEVVTKYEEVLQGNLENML